MGANNRMRLKDGSETDPAAVHSGAFRSGAERVVKLDQHGDLTLKLKAVNIETPHHVLR